jgi:hypothetical protein
LENKPELTGGDPADPLAIILDEIGRLRKCPENNTQEIQLTLNNKFPPVLNTLDRKKNLKTDTINEAIKYVIAQKEVNELMRRNPFFVSHLFFVCIVILLPFFYSCFSYGVIFTPFFPFVFVVVIFCHLVSHVLGC